MANTTLFKIKVIKWSNSITYETNWHCMFWWNTVEVYCLCHKRRIPSLCPKHQCWRNWSWSILWRPKRPPRTNIKKKRRREKFLFIIGHWNANVGSQGMLGVTGKFGLGVQNEAGQRLTEFCQEDALVIASTLFQ